MIIATLCYRQGTSSYYHDRLREKNFRELITSKYLWDETTVFREEIVTEASLQHQFYNISHKRASLHPVHPQKEVFSFKRRDLSEIFEICVLANLRLAAEI